MQIRIKHRTRYRYEAPAALGPHVIRLRPAAHSRTPLIGYNLDIKPGGLLRWQHDPWGNRIARVTFEKAADTRTFEVIVDATFDMRPINPFDFFIDDRCTEVPFEYPDGLGAELAPFLSSEAPSAKLSRFVDSVPFTGKTIDYLVALNQAVAAGVRYIIRNEPGLQTSEETLTIGSGSCRDSAVLLVDALRMRGLAARFASGYLVQLRDDGNIPGERKGVSADVLDLHAWAEVYLAGAGWVGLDGTSGLLCGEGHIPLACTVSPLLAAPLTGTSSQATTHFEVEMTVARVGHEPHPQRPYKPEEWTAIIATGASVDQQLNDAGLQLTSGGEPTWTSREHPEAPEWSTDAVGLSKWNQGLRLTRELRKRIGRGAVVLQRMGKQYPGESLPRWVLQLIWRHDDVPIWRDADRIAFGGISISDGDKPRVSTETEVRAAERFGETLAVAIGVEPLLVPGYEDPWHAIKTEADLPPDIDPTRADLDAPEERQRLARTLTRGMGQPLGFALPVQVWNAKWNASRWEFRRGRMYLVPGDSPMGLRLPLDRLRAADEPMMTADPVAMERPIDFDPRQPVLRRSTESSTAAVGTRTALCFEPRDGVIHIFVPPLPDAESYLDLMAAIENTSNTLDMPVRIEGYPPPSDPRLRSLMVTPDPGVIEINLPVAYSFADYTEWMDLVADAANHSGLTLQKFQLDGRESGSGGGNHITLGGPTALESPFLKDPVLTGGVLRYLQNHPSLSYLFTGLFVGPTSQAPRMDEARHDALYELELALQQIDDGAQSVFPWYVDRLLRNLLVDVSGNAHRTEVCIDKLYDPSGPAGRQGLLEFRAFEMPPHPQMAGAQMLLMRSLIARLAASPYKQPLVRWGTQLHDRFMLPHYLWSDFQDVVLDMRAHGIALELEWYRPFLDFRCPVIGTLQLPDVMLELRNALEPWPTLGEEAQGSITSRYVDSSLERIQVTAHGLMEGRHQVVVNGLALPMTPTGRAREYVAGVKFRAWQPPHCLQPHIGIHHPLRFDVVDLWGERSLGGCQYHVWHPEGRGFEHAPLTAFEAAARRAQRFTLDGMAPWPVRPTATTPSPEQPYTLDLRRFAQAQDRMR